MENNNKLLKFFSDSESAKIKIITKKFTLEAFKALLPYIKKLDSLKIVISDNSLFINNFKDSEKRNYLINYNEVNMLNVDAELKLKNDLMSRYYAQMFKELINDKIFIKTLDSCEGNIKYSTGLKDKPKQSIITNTEEISAPSLGIIKSADKFSYLESTNDDEEWKEYDEEFDQNWNNVRMIDVSQKYIEKLNSIYRDHTPSDIYYFNLYHIFNNNLEEYQNNNTNKHPEWKNSEIYKKLYDFQKVAVHGIIEKIEKYNGCILADSVGLGKTFEALAVIKYYESLGYRVLVLAPKKLKHNWDLYRNNSELNPLIDDKFNYDVLNHTDVNREKGVSGSIDLSSHKWDNYDLVVIDESHNFRNRKWTDDESANKTRYQHLMEKVIKSGRKTKVLLLTATPVNNNMLDINNQIKFITNDNDSAFREYGFESITKVCRDAEKKSLEWSKLNDSQKNLETFERVVGPQFKKLMDLISIARSRRQIVTNYKTSIVFPKRLDPLKLQINQTSGVTHSSNIKTIYEMIRTMTFAIYTPINYIKDDIRDKYIEKYMQKNKDHFKQTDREKSLTKIMLTNWLKRYESSINSFMMTINKFYEKNLKILSWLNDLEDNQDYNFNDESEIDFDDDEFDDIFSKKIEIRKKDIDFYKCKSDIEHDLKLIEEIKDIYKNVNKYNDDKLSKLKEVMLNKIKNPINKENKKVIIFSSFADTAKYIYDSINEEFKDMNIYSCLITGSYNECNHPHIKTNDMNELLTYFSPKSKGLEKTKLNKDSRIDILIATDCISEGQNLQDCDFLVNYDIHWNPVKLIQRYGRIDRIGSDNSSIQMVNFWPDIDLDEYMKLQNIVITKMNKASHASTGDENILDNTTSENSYRINQLKELQEKVLDLEDLKGDICLSNLTFSEFTSDLQMYLETNSKKLINQPTGIFSIAKNENIYKQGIIFLFKNLSENKDDNFIEPYYLVYADMDGKVIFSYNDATKILGILKSIAVNQNNLNTELITKFNNETEFGFKMEKYSTLLNNVINSIKKKKEGSQFSKLFDKQAAKNERPPEFELISFLIIGD